MPVAKKRPAAKKPTKKPAAKKKSLPKLKTLGRVVHYYDRIGVVIVEVAAPIAVGDMVRFRHGDDDFTETVTSMQFEHQPVAKAKKGDVVGMKVSKEPHDKALVLAV